MKKIIPHLLVFTANLMYSINFSIAKDVMPAYIQPFGFIFIRVACATLFFWIAGLWVNDKVEKADGLLLLKGGIFGIAINQLFFFAGLNLTSPLNASIFMISTPLLVTLFTTLQHKGKLQRKQFAGLCLGFCGALLLLLTSGRNHSSYGNWKGDLLVLLNAASYAYFLVITQPLMIKYHPMTVMKWVFLIGLIPVTFVGMSEFLAIRWETFSDHIWISVIFVVFAVTILAYSFNLTAMRLISPTVVASYIYLQPLLTALFAVLWGKDILSFQKVISGLLVIAGVYMVSSEK